MDTRVRK